MKDLDKALENLKFDKRMTGWNLNNGVLSQNDLQEHLKGLKDLGANAKPLDLEDTSDDGFNEDSPHN